MRAFQLTHRTTYRYSAPVSVSRHVGYLTPLEAPGHQVVDHHLLTITPTPTEQVTRTDYFGNRQLHFQIEQPHNELVINAYSKVRVAPKPILDPPGGGPTCAEVRERLRASYDAGEILACQMANPSRLTLATEAIAGYAHQHLAPDRPFLEAALALNKAVFDDFEFDPEATDVSTPVAEVFEMKRGVCQDFAHFMLACLRTAGLPGRYVSGYILTLPPPGQERLQGADASHAWVSIYLPDTGWIDLDPTNNLVCGDEHIVVATGRDFGDVSPLRGAVLGGGNQEIVIEVTMEPEG